MRPEAVMPHMVAVAGPNGSGKTTLSRGLAPFLAEKLPGLIAIDPDALAAVAFPGQPYEAVILKAAQAAEGYRERALRERRHVLFESVFSAPDKLDYLKRAKAAGYFVQMVFVATDDPAINCSRVATRVAKGGHAVPIARIVARYPKSIAQGAEALTFVDRGYVFDNTPDGEPASPVFTTVSGLVSGLHFSTMNGAGCPWPWAELMLDRVAAHAYSDDHGDMALPGDPPSVSG